VEWVFGLQANNHQVRLEASTPEASGKEGARAHLCINSPFVDDFAKLHLAAEAMHAEGKGLPAGTFATLVRTCRRTIHSALSSPFDYLPTDVALPSKIQHL
jgi:hypothetical protein